MEIKADKANIISASWIAKLKEKGKRQFLEQSV
jgi:hypothetical protein